MLVVSSTQRMPHASFRPKNSDAPGWTDMSNGCTVAGMKFRTVAMVLATLLLAGCGGASTPASATSAKPAASAGPSRTFKLKAGTQHVATDGPLYIAMEKGFFKQQGLEVEFVDINGVDAIGPLANGQMDVSVGAIYSGLFNAIGRGVEIRLVATKGSIAVRPNREKPASALVLRKELADSGAIKDYQDLRGRTIAVASLGATQEETLDAALRQGGMSVADVSLKTMPFPDTLPALANGSIDAAMELQPWIAQGTAKGILRVWRDSAEMTPGLQTNALTFGPSVPQIGREAGDRFITAYTQGLRYYNDAIGPKRANWNEFVQIMTRNTTLKDPALYEQVGWTYMNPDCSLNATSVVDNLDWYEAHGYVKQRPDLRVAIDDSYCQYALKQLGPYMG